MSSTDLILITECVHPIKIYKSSSIMQNIVHMCDSSPEVIIQSQAFTGSDKHRGSAVVMCVFIRA